MTITPETVAKMAQDYTAAWNSKSAEAVASFYAEDGEIVINRGDPWDGRAKVAEMAAGFYADVPDLSLACDDIRLSGTHAVYVWTFTGHDANTGNPLNIKGWEEWDLNDDLKVKASRGWFDADDYARQVEGT
ncbi:MAG: nuclear transport factor 2 family protein [Tepidamorphaceae bacterium]